MRNKLIFSKYPFNKTGKKFEQKFNITEILTNLQYKKKKFSSALNFLSFFNSIVIQLNSKNNSAEERAAISYRKNRTNAQEMTKLKKILLNKKLKAWKVIKIEAGGDENVDYCGNFDEDTSDKQIAQYSGSGLETVFFPENPDELKNRLC